LKKLRIYSILGCAIEILDVKMLLVPLEEKFNLPTFSIELGNDKWIFYGKLLARNRWSDYSLCNGGHTF
jgi:hypothetical protein